MYLVILYCNFELQERAWDAKYLPCFQLLCKTFGFT